MGKKRFWHSMSPLEWIILGVAISSFDLLTKRSFDPFVLLGFIFIAIFEKYFRRKKRTLPLNVISLVCGLILVLTIKLFVIDFKVMVKEHPELSIRKNSRVFYQPSMFRLRLGDIVLYRSEGKHKYYLAVLKDMKNNLYGLSIPPKEELKEVPKKQIKGKVILIIPPMEQKKGLNE